MPWPFTESSMTSLERPGHLFKGWAQRQPIFDHACGFTEKGEEQRVQCSSETFRLCHADWRSPTDLPCSFAWPGPQYKFAAHNFAQPYCKTMQHSMFALEDLQSISFPETDSGQDGPNALRYAHKYMDCADYLISNFVIKCHEQSGVGWRLSITFWRKP